MTGNSNSERRVYGCTLEAILEYGKSMPDHSKIRAS